MDITFENIYDLLESNKSQLNFIPRTDLDMDDFGLCPFSTLFSDQNRDDIPNDIKDFLIKAFNITKRDYHFIQIQKYEIGEYILPHKDPYPCFGLVTLSTSNLDGIVVQQKDGTYKFIPDKAGNFVEVPRFSWHWVNPVREKTRYTAVYGLNSLDQDINNILDQ
jgi:hypothetical protein